MTDDTDDLGEGIGFLLSDLHARMIKDGLIPSPEDPGEGNGDQEQSEP